MAKSKRKTKRGNAYLDQDSKTGSVCEHLRVCVEEPPDPTNVVCSCDECPNGNWSKTEYYKEEKLTKKSKPFRTVKSFKCYSGLRKRETKIKDPTIIAKDCPYRKEDADKVAYEGVNWYD